MKIVKTKQAGVVSYIRPSVNAIKATCYKKAGQELQVTPCIQGWFEVRLTDKDGETYAEFIRREDVRYSVTYLVSIPVKYLLITLKKARYKKIKSAMIKLYRKVLVPST